MAITYARPGPRIGDLRLVLHLHAAGPPASRTPHSSIPANAPSLTSCTSVSQSPLSRAACTRMKATWRAHTGIRPPNMDRCDGRPASDVGRAVPDELSAPGAFARHSRPPPVSPAPRMPRSSLRRQPPDRGQGARCRSSRDECIRATQPVSLNKANRHVHPLCRNRTDAVTHVRRRWRPLSSPHERKGDLARVGREPAPGEQLTSRTAPAAPNYEVL